MDFSSPFLEEITPLGHINKDPLAAPAPRMTSVWTICAVSKGNNLEIIQCV